VSDKSERHCVFSAYFYIGNVKSGILQLRLGGTRAETRFHLSVKGTSPCEFVGVTVQSITGSRGVRVSW
jgi:hypothetical protein